jgi:hypothetical protein
VGHGIKRPRPDPGPTHSTGLQGRDFRLAALNGRNEVSIGPRIRGFLEDVNAPDVLVVTSTGQHPGSNELTSSSHIRFFQMDDPDFIGGLSIWVRNDWAANAQVIAVPRHDTSVMWLKLELGGQPPIIIAAVYARPGDPQSLALTMRNIEKNCAYLRDNFKNATIMCSGDFNVRTGSFSGDDKADNADRLNLFFSSMQRARLTVLRNTRKGLYTFRNTTGGRSIVDYFAVSDPGRLVRSPDGALYETHSTITLGSDHCLLSLTFRLQFTPMSPEWGKTPTSRVLWDAHTTTQYLQSIKSSPALMEIISKCDAVKAGLISGFLHHRAATSMVASLTQSFVTALVGFTKSSSSTRTNTSQRKKVAHVDNAPEHIQSLLNEQAQILRDLSNMPGNAPAPIRLLQRSNEIDAVIRAHHNTQRSELDTNKMSKLSQAISKHEKLAFWKLLSEIKQEIEPEFPTFILDPTTGNTTKSRNQTLAVLAAHFVSVSKAEDPEALEASKAHTPDQCKTLKVAKEQSILTCSAPPSLPFSTGELHTDSPITPKEYRDAASSRTNGKQVGVLEEAYEHFKLGGEVVEHIACQLMNLFQELAFVPPCLLSSIISLLYKRKGDRQLARSYRPITLSSCFLKIYERVLERRLATQAERLGLISPNQHCCKPKAGATDAVSDVLESLEGADKAIVVSVDLSKAFDRVSLPLLFAYLRRKGVKGKLWHALMSTYKNVSTRIRIGKHQSIPFSLEAGVKQGSVLSPLLFVLFINPLLEKLKASGAGLPDRQGGLGEDRSPGHMFMDDLILTADTQEGMEELLKIVKVHCAESGCVINADKTEIIQKNAPIEAENLRIAEGLPPEAVKTHMKYVGIQISAPFSPNSWTTHTEYRAKQMHKAFGLMRRLGFSLRGYHIPAGLEVVEKVFKKILLYGMEIVELTTNQRENLDKALAKVLRNILGLHPNTPTQWVYRETGILPPSIEAEVSLLRFWAKKLRKRQAGLDDSLVYTNESRLNRLATNVFDRWEVAKPERANFEKAQSRFGLFMGKDKWKTWLNDHAGTQASKEFTAWLQTLEANDALHFSALAKAPTTLIPSDLPFFKAASWQWTLHLTPKEVTTILRFRARWTGLHHYSHELQHACPLCCLQSIEHDSPEHALFACPAFAPHREPLARALHNRSHEWGRLNAWDKIAFLLSEARVGSPLGAAVRFLLGQITDRRSLLDYFEV